MRGRKAPRAQGGAFEGIENSADEALFPSGAASGASDGATGAVVTDDFRPVLLRHGNEFPRIATGNGRLAMITWERGLWKRTR